MIRFTNLEKQIEAFKKYVIQQSKSNLSKESKKATGALYNSIDAESKVSQNSFELDFIMEQYGQFVDLGVKGKTSSAKAPNSPFRFGSGTGRKGGLTEGINRWVRDRRFQFRDRQSGKFLSYETTAFLITRSVYNKGIEASRFFSKPFEVGFERLPDELVEAYGLDVEQFLKDTLNK